VACCVPVTVYVTYAERGYAYTVNREEAVIQLNSACKIGRLQTFRIWWDSCNRASMEL
jgi:hypothetical protein